MSNPEYEEIVASAIEKAKEMKDDHPESDPAKRELAVVMDVLAVKFGFEVGKNT